MFSQDNIRDKIRKAQLTMIANVLHRVNEFRFAVKTVEYLANIKHEIRKLIEN